MLISYHGHAEFMVELADGRRVLFDPFPPQVNFPFRRVRADVVCVSHHHYDHNYVDKVDGKPVVIDTEGNHSPLPGIRVTSVTAFHDEEQGKKRGEILCTTIAAEGLKVTHLGDLGVVPDQALRDRLFMPDILLVPVGGIYTLDAKAAKATADLLQPRVIIPMHYRNERGGLEQISTLKDFVEVMKPATFSVQPLLRVTRDDLSQQPRLVELTIR